MTEQKSKKDRLQEAWVPISKRLPPDTDEEILCWNYWQGKGITMTAWVARLAAEYLLEHEGDKEMSISWDRRISHWMPVYEPKRG